MQYQIYTIKISVTPFQWPSRIRWSFCCWIHSLESDKKKIMEAIMKHIFAFESIEEYEKHQDTIQRFEKKLKKYQ